MKNAKILIATHKKYEMPSNELYLPIHVGAYNKESLGYQKDSLGINIAELNPLFCELTGLYWAWKNLNNDYVGLVHYRRYFKGSYSFKVNGKIKKILNYGDIEKNMSDTDVLLPKKRNYYIETIYSHYKHTMYIEPLDITGDIIKEKFPNYFPEFEKLKKTTKAHMFNMFVMKKKILDDYCEWLFTILFELYKTIDNGQYDDFHKRFYGRISEMLLDVYINTNNIKYKEIKVINIEGQKMFKKGFALIKAKIFKKKYEKSF